MITRILGIDPGSRNLGLGLIERRRGSLRLLYAETISASATLPIYVRLDKIYIQLKARIEELQPEVVAIEDTFFAKNAQSAFKLGLARGVAVAACLGRGLKIYEYAPTAVKKVVTGHGRADKEQVRKMVGLSLGGKMDMGFDATDALAVAICHAHTGQLESRLEC